MLAGPNVYQQLYTVPTVKRHTVERLSFEFASFFS
jgi:hypothetical protein